MTNNVDDPEHWLKLARETRALANRVSFETAKKRLLELAKDFDRIAAVVCVNRKASISPTLSRASDFCVNFLCNGQEEISRAFSDSARRAERFGVGRWIVEVHSPPHIEDAQATLFCRRISEIPFETHTLFLGRVYEVRFRDSITPRVYLDGCYRNVQF